MGDWLLYLRWKSPRLHKTIPQRPSGIQEYTCENQQETILSLLRGFYKGAIGDLSQLLVTKDGYS